MIDPALIRITGFRISEDRGRLLASVLGLSRRSSGIFLDLFALFASKRVQDPSIRKKSQKFSRNLPEDLRDKPKTQVTNSSSRNFL